MRYIDGTCRNGCKREGALDKVTALITNMQKDMIMMLQGAGRQSSVRIEEVMEDAASGSVAFPPPPPIPAPAVPVPEVSVSGPAVPVPVAEAPADAAPEDPGAAAGLAAAGAALAPDGDGAAVDDAPAEDVADL